MRPKVTPQYEQVAAAADGSLTARELAERTGLTVRQVYLSLYVARQKGLKPVLKRAGWRSRGNEVPLWLRVADLHKTGMTASQVAEKLGANRHLVIRAAQHARRKHKMKIYFAPERPPRHAVQQLRDRGELVTGGGIFQLMMSLPEPVAVWLVSCIPAEGNLSDAMRAVIVDAYYEENGDGAMG